MTGLELSDVARVYWQEIAKKCSRAVVFIDNSAAESLHWSGGLDLLENALAVKEFSSFEAADHKTKKGVFIVKNPGLKVNQRIINDIISNSKLEYCILISWCQPNVLSLTRYPARDFNTDDKSGLEWLEDSLLEWMGNRNYTAEIFYYPVFVCSPIKETFFTPSYLDVFPLLPDDVTRALAYWKVFNPGQPIPARETAGYWPILPEELKTSVRQLIANFHSLFSSLNIKEDIWSVGPFAKCVADELEGWMPARNRRKTAQGSVSLVLVDRTLDLAGPAVSSDDSVLGKILESHENLEGHTFDVKVDLAKLLQVPCPQLFAPSSLGNPGCKNAEEEADELRNLFFGAEKEVVGSLHESLVKGSPRKSESGRKKIFSTQALETDLKEYDGDYDSVMSNLASVSRAQALLNSSQSDLVIRRKRLQSLAGQLGPDIYYDRQSEGVLAQITDLVLGRADSRLTLADVVQLLVYVYSSAHTGEKFRDDEEERLKSVLGEAVLKEGKAGNLPPVLEQIFQREGSGEMNELVALNLVNYIWSKLEGIAVYRESLNRYSTLLDEDGNYSSFLSQLLGDVYSESRMEVPDLHHHSGGLGAMLRSGLGWLGGSTAKQHPRQNPWVIVFVIGGVTPTEIKQLQRVVAGTDSKLTVAGTGILTSRAAMDLLFNLNPLHTDK